MTGHHTLYSIKQDQFEQVKSMFAARQIHWSRSDRPEISEVSFVKRERDDELQQ